MASNVANDRNVKFLDYADAYGFAQQRKGSKWRGRPADAMQAAALSAGSVSNSESTVPIAQPAADFFGEGECWRDAARLRPREKLVRQMLRNKPVSSELGSSRSMADCVNFSRRGAGWAASNVAGL